MIDTYNIYFSFKVAINSLMRILRDPSLASYHLKVVGSLMFIFKVCKHEKDSLFCFLSSFFHLVWAWKDLNPSDLFSSLTGKIRHSSRLCSV